MNFKLPGTDLGDKKSEPKDEKTPLSDKEEEEEEDVGQFVKPNRRPVDILKRGIAATEKGKGWRIGFFNLFLLQFIGLLPGVIFYAYFSTRVPWSGDTWQDLPGLSNAMLLAAYIMALLFIFRIHWSYGRWTESREQVGLITTQLRDLCSTVTAGSFAFTTLDSALSQYTPSETHFDDLALHELRARQKIAEHDACQRDRKRKEKQKKAEEEGHAPVSAGLLALEDCLRPPFKEITTLDLYWAAKGWFGVLVDILKERNEMEDYESILDSSMLRFGQMITDGFEASGRPAHPPKAKVPPNEHRCQKLIIAHQILQAAVRRCYEVKLLSLSEHQKALNQMEGMLGAAFGLIKLKTVSVPGPITKLGLAAIIVYSALFPTFIAYQFHVGLSVDALDGNYALQAFPFVMYLLSTSGAMFLLAGLRFMAQQLVKPFDEQKYDLPLITMRVNLWGDIDTMDSAFAAVYKKERSHPYNIFLFNALKDNQPKVKEAKPEGSPLRNTTPDQPQVVQLQQQQQQQQDMDPIMQSLVEAMTESKGKQTVTFVAEETEEEENRI